MSFGVWVNKNLGGNDDDALYKEKKKGTFLLLFFSTNPYKRTPV